MEKAIIARKVGMTQIFMEDGSLVPVTVLQAGPCTVTQVKTVDNDGYSAVQIGFEDKKKRSILHNLFKDTSRKLELILRRLLKSLDLRIQKTSKLVKKSKLILLRQAMWLT